MRICVTHQFEMYYHLDEFRPKYKLTRSPITTLFQY